MRLLVAALGFAGISLAALYAKTGWGGIDGQQQIGLWTGWVDDGGKITGFALNLDIDTVDDARKRQEVGRAILGRLGVY